MIAHVCECASGRVFKEVIALQEFEEVKLIYKSTPHNDLLSMVKNSRMWNTDSQLESAMQDCDIVHVHVTTNNAYLLKMCGMLSDAPLILDMHDETSSQIETDRFHTVVPSHGYASMHKNASVIYSMVPSCLFPEITDRTVGCGVLASSVCTKTQYRDYREVQGGLHYEMCIYPGAYDNTSEYRNVMRTIPYTRLLSELTRYEFGYAGASNSGHDINICMTNKLFDYIAAGIPVVSYNSSEISEYVSRLWCGHELERITEPFDLCTSKWKDELAKLRWEFCMETQIPKLLKIYKEATNEG